MIVEIADINIEGITYKRKLNVEGSLFKFIYGRIEIPADILYYTLSDIEIGRNCFTSKKTNTRTGQKTFEAGKTVIFIVDNETFVNPLNGNYVLADTPGAMGEYDYYMFLLNSMNLLVNNGITSLETQLLPSALNNAVNAGRLDYE